MKPKRILIISHPRDLHARAVAYGIRSKGHVCEEFYFGDFPTLTAVSLAVSDSRLGPSLTIRQRDNDLDTTSPFDTIWFRRRQRPWLPDSMHTGDHEVAFRQCDRFLNDVLIQLDHPTTIWVNDWKHEPAALLKSHQLGCARRAG